MNGKIRVANAPIADPEAVVVHLERALLAHGAVVRAIGLERLTLPAVARVAVALALGDGQRLDGGLHIGRLGNRFAKHAHRK